MTTIVFDMYASGEVQKFNDPSNSQQIKISPEGAKNEKHSNPGKYI